jgi:hypothetical protein
MNHFTKKKGDIDKQDFIHSPSSIVLPELTFFEGTTENKVPNEEELNSGGEVEQEVEEAQPRRSTRSTQPSSRLRDYVTYKIGLVAMIENQPQDIAHL